jgi:hypothetical protein
VRKGKISKAKSAKGEHEFTQNELQKMFYVADVRAKAILSTGISLGFSVEPFSELRRDFIESLINKAQAENLDFIGFDYERKKEGVDSRSHLTPESRDSLKAWFEYIDKKRGSKSEWVWANGNSGHLDDQTLNDIIKDLVVKANIQTTGKIRFHLLRKFLTDAIHESGFDSWETKRVLGKEIPTTDDTYLKKLSRAVDSKFPQAYDYIRLSGFANKNHLHIEELEQKVQSQDIKIEQQTLEIEAMKRIMQYRTPKEDLEKVVNDMIKEGLIDKANLGKLRSGIFKEIAEKLLSEQA